MIEEIAAAVIGEHERWMGEAILEARSALERGDRPIGAVIVHRGRIIGRGTNRASTDRSNISHAELNALMSCASYLEELGRECVIYTTCEPCVMCLGAIVMANLRRVVFGITDNYIGARALIAGLPYVRDRIHLYLGGIREDECAALYRRYSEPEYLLMLGWPAADSEAMKGAWASLR